LCGRGQLGIVGEHGNLPKALRRPQRRHRRHGGDVLDDRYNCLLYVNYRIRVTLVVPRPEAHGPRFVEFARKHQYHALIRMLRDLGSARAWLQ
jgi:hypothetical protein